MKAQKVRTTHCLFCKLFYVLHFPSVFSVLSGDCVIENDTTSSPCRLSVEYTAGNATHTADFTYKGYPVNLVSNILIYVFHFVSLSLPDAFPLTQEANHSRARRNRFCANYLVGTQNVCMVSLDEVKKQQSRSKGQDASICIRPSTCSYELFAVCLRNIIFFHKKFQFVLLGSGTALGDNVRKPRCQSSDKKRSVLAEDSDLQV